MKKLILFLLLPFWIMAQTSTGQETEFDYGIKNNSTQTITTPTYLATYGTDGTSGKIPSAYIAKDADVIHTTGDETKSGQLTLSKSLNLTNVENPETLPTVAVNGAAGNLTGEYLYGVSYYTADGKDTGIPDVTSVLTLSAGRVDISNIPISPNPLVVGRRIYRTRRESFCFCYCLISC